MFKTLSTLLKAALSTNPRDIKKIKRNFLGYSGNQTRGCWVRSKIATSVLCNPLPLNSFIFNRALVSLFQYWTTMIWSKECRSCSSVAIFLLCVKFGCSCPCCFGQKRNESFCFKKSPKNRTQINLVFNTSSGFHYGVVAPGYSLE